MKVRDALRVVIADGRVTEDEWRTQLKPTVAPLPNRASDDTRVLAELFAEDGVKLDDGVRRDLRSVLRGFGYDATEGRPAGQSAADFVRALVQSNVGERDDEFDRLSRATGQTEGELTIGVVDAGLDATHPVFEGKLWTNPNEIPDDGLDNDGNGLADDVHGYNFAAGGSTLNTDPHGTHVTAIATRGTDRVKAIGAVAVGAPLYGDKVVQAIDYAVEHGARVINMSFALEDFLDLPKVLAAMQRHPDVLFVKTAGNKGRNHTPPLPPEPGGPGDLKSYNPNAFLGRQQLSNMAVIGAADRTGQLWEYSSWGVPWVTHAGVGADVLSAEDGPRYRVRSGTSFAAPAFVNAAAKMLLLDERLTPSQLKEMLADTSTVSAEWSPLVASSGVIDIERAMRLAALTGLIRRGAAPQSAADQIGLAGDERTQLLGLAPKYGRP